jgi:hypothetical protein
MCSRFAANSESPDRTKARAHLYLISPRPILSAEPMPVPNDWLHVLRRAGVQALAWIGLLLLIRFALILLHLSAK